MLQKCDNIMLIKVSISSEKLLIVMEEEIYAKD